MSKNQKINEKKSECSEFDTRPIDSLVPNGPGHLKSIVAQLEGPPKPTSKNQNSHQVYKFILRYDDSTTTLTKNVINVMLIVNQTT